jgi:hypothetical protein
MDAPDRADLQPNASYDARLAGEDSEPEGTTQRSTSLARLRGALSLLGAEINAEAERSRGAAKRPRPSCTRPQRRKSVGRSPTAIRGACRASFAPQPGLSFRGRRPSPDRAGLSSDSSSLDEWSNSARLWGIAALFLPDWEFEALDRRDLSGPGCQATDGKQLALVDPAGRLSIHNKRGTATVVAREVSAIDW